MAKRAKRVTVESQLRDAIRSVTESRRLTCYAVAKRAGVVPSVVAKFLAGKRIWSDTFAKLAGALNLELAPKATEPKEGGQ